MANYTQPDTQDHQDSSQDWLNSALIMTRALGFLLKQNQGIIVSIVGDMDLGEGIEKVIVWNNVDKISVIKYDGDLPEGEMIHLINNDEN